MKKNRNSTLTKIISVLFIVCFFISPALKSQTIIYSESFDADSSSMPNGWNATQGGFHVETSNPSNTYPGATGIVNLTIRNDSATGIYEVITPSISTINYSAISVLWGARLTVNFPLNGSAITGFYWSNDNGTTWNAITYSENSNNSIWEQDNGGSRISLQGGAANQASLKFKWVVSIINGTQGTYRIDDFDVMGIMNTGVNAISQNLFSVAAYPNPFENNTSLKINSKKDEVATIEIYNMLGEKISRQEKITLVAGENVIVLSPQYFSSGGIYFVELISADETKTIRIQEN